MTTAEPPVARSPLVRISRQALHLAGRHAVEAGAKEIGGIMVGWWEGNCTAVVHDLLIVPDVRAGRNHYNRRHSAAHSVLTTYREGLDDHRVGYVGEWHTHPAPQRPSETDRAALAAIARQGQSAVALVVLAVTEDHVTPYALVGQAGRWPRRRRLQQATVKRMDP